MWATHFAKLERLLGHGSHEILEDGRLLYQLSFFFPIVLTESYIAFHGEVGGSVYLGLARCKVMMSVPISPDSNVALCLGDHA